MNGTFMLHLSPLNQFTKKISSFDAKKKIKTMLIL